MSDKELRRQSEAIINTITGLWRRISTLDADDPAMEIPGAQMRVCGILYESPKTMSALSEELGISHSAITQIADRLERAEMVERVPEEDDRRCKRLRLTERGAAIVKARTDRRVVRTMEVLKRVPERDRDAAVAALQVLLEAGQEREKASEVAR